MRIAEERVTEPFNASGALENLKGIMATLF